MNCKYCNKKISEKQIRMKRRPSRPKHHNTYCNVTCFNKRGESNLTQCVQCGDKVKVRTDINSGRELCSACYKTKVSRYFTNDEIMYLVSINPGVGLKYFVRELWFKTGDSFKRRERVRYFLEEIGEYDGNDYVNWLENPKMMRRVLQDEVPEELLWSIVGEKRSVVSNQVKRARIRDGLPVKDRTNYYVNIPPLFRWGKLEELRAKIFGE